jgi:hypothetical protein
MNVKKFAIALGLLLGSALCFAASPQLGTWKLNEAKSKWPAGVPKNTTVVYEESGDSIKVSIDGTKPDGSATHNDWTGKFDGKDYPVTGDSAQDSRSYKQIDDHTLSFAAKKDGKVFTSGTIKVSADGKSRTVTSSGTDPQGKKYKGTAVYDKQ